MSEDDKLLKEAKKWAWEDRLAHKNWKVRNDANIDIAAVCDGIMDPKDPRLKEFGKCSVMLLLLFVLLSLPVSAVSMDRQAGVMMSPLWSAGKAAMVKYRKDNAFLVCLRDLGRWIWQRIWKQENTVHLSPFLDGD